MCGGCQAAAEARRKRMLEAQKQRTEEIVVAKKIEKQIIENKELAEGQVYASAYCPYCGRLVGQCIHFPKQTNAV